MADNPYVDGETVDPDVDATPEPVPDYGDGDDLFPYAQCGDDGDPNDREVTP